MTKTSVLSIQGYNQGHITVDILLYYFYGYNAQSKTCQHMLMYIEDPVAVELRTAHENNRKTERSR